MGKTIKELAEKLSVSKQTIQYHYNKLSAIEQQRDSRGYILINDNAEKIIRSKVTNKNRQKSDKQPPKDDQFVDSSNVLLVKELRAEVNRLRADNNRQITAKDRQIENMQKLLDQSQQLQLMAEKKIAALEALKQAENDVDQSKANVVTSAPQTHKKETSANKRDFWHKLFK